MVTLSLKSESGMTLWVKAFATKPNNLSLFPVIYDVEREN